MGQRSLESSRASVDGKVSEAVFPLTPLLQPCAPQLRQILVDNGPKPDESQFLPRPFSPTILNPLRDQHLSLNEAHQSKDSKYDFDVETSKMCTDLGLSKSMVGYYSNSCTSPDMSPRFGKWLRGKIAQVDRSAWGPEDMLGSSSGSKSVLDPKEPVIRQFLPPNAILRTGWSAGDREDGYELTVEERIEAQSWRYDQEQNLRATQRRKAAALRAARLKKELQRRQDEDAVSVEVCETFRPKRAQRKSGQTEDSNDEINGNVPSSHEEEKGDKQAKGKRPARQTKQLGFSAFQAKTVRAAPPEASKSRGKTRSTRANRLRRLETQLVERKREKKDNDESRANSALDHRLSQNRRKSLRAMAPKTWLDKVPFKFIAGKPLSAADVVTERVYKAFQHSMDEMSACLPGSLVLHVLCDLGLVPRGAAERKVVSTFLGELGVLKMSLRFEEFEQLVERVREQVMIVQQPLFEKHFLHIHEGLSRPISMDFDESRVTDLLKSFGCKGPTPELVEELRTLFAECPQPEEGVEHDIFQALVQHTQERLAEVDFDEVKRIQEETGLSLVLAREFRREVPELYSQYSNWVKRKMKEEEDQESHCLRNTKIDLQGVVTILGDIGVTPISERVEGSVRGLLNYLPHGLAHSKFFDINEFLMAIKHIRKMNMKRREVGLAHLFERHSRKGRILDYRSVSQILSDYGLTPRTWEQQHLVGELMMDLDVHGKSEMSFQDVSLLVCRIIEHQEQKHRARLKAYAEYIELDVEKFQSYVDMFEDLDAGDNNALGQRTTKQLLTNYDKTLTSQAFSELYAQLDTNFNHTLELPEFLRLLGHLERDRREKEDLAKLEEQKKNGTAKPNTKPKKLTPFNILPASFDEFLPFYHDATPPELPK